MKKNSNRENDRFKNIKKKKSNKNYKKPNLDKGKKKKEALNNRNIINHEDRGDETRLNKYISETGICSRREADKLIESGRVTINGVKATMGTKVSKGQVVKVDGKKISKEEELVYIVLNKPVGITCTTESKIRGNIVDFVGHSKRIFPIGRLDKDSQGLILLTNDGDIVNKILRAGNNHEKEYIVTVDKKITNEFIKGMSSGVRILGTITKECFVKKEDDYTFRIILTQGMNRQIRRMSEALGYEVKKLKRIRIMNINLGDLKIGKWRDLTRKELVGLNDLIQSSKKTKEIDE
ncbi:23S rRNA pseudouridine(2604) synthase RluF [Clostridium sardiniense]|uniref:Pseudouridine synthase n=1 Tax=Clostridium sardiniense TaxID=29369 RepID=A0ABS7KVI3_CLOSR|nr:23S rRNA pseudouridine(2604) synthase RluF [Clostridium sardiniense]MBY0754612.1 23S rRNA pseudouridine(2604) synthase RluF [Clostridium sardiniense]MDQ0460786.1 23S rRNA pseudouridine2604 synthase [Clostridium sardiniense]